MIGSACRIRELLPLPGDWTSFCRWAICVTCLPAWVGCLVKVPSNTGSHYCHWIRKARPGLILTSSGTGTGPTTSESTPPAHARATHATRPATYLSTRS